MCRNIKNLFNFEPPATDVEIRAASVQFVRKISGSTKPSKVNEVAFEQAVNNISAIITILLNSMTTPAEPINRETEAEKALDRAAKRFRADTSSSSV